MKILLVFPSSKEAVKSLFMQTEGDGIGKKPPLGILYIASYINDKSNHKALVWDLETYPMDDQLLAKSIRDLNPDLVGISCWTDFWYPCLSLAKSIKKINSNIHIVMGGPHVGIFPGETLSQYCIDSIIIGDGEKPTLNLLNYLEFDEPLMEKGIYLSGQIKNDRYQFYIETELDELPIPDRNLLPFHGYSSVLSSQKISTTMITSRGCPYQCVYCKLNFQKTQSHSASYVVDEMEEISSLGFSEVEIYDDTFTWSETRLLEICNEILNRKIKISWAVRDRVNNIKLETLELMGQAGCNRIHLGIESGNERILKIIKKKINLDKAASAVYLAKKAGLKVLAYYMFGLPGETQKEAAETIEFAIKLNSDYAEFNVAIPYPGTQMYKMALEKKIIEFDYWRKFASDPSPDFAIPSVYEEYMNMNQLIQLSHKATRLYYFRLSMIWKQLIGCSSISEFIKKGRMGITLLKSILSGK